MLMVGTIAGVLLATVLNNGGGAWDNAKKYIESGHLKDDAGNVLGKKSDAHAAAVVGDTVGDPFKDTAGPSLHVLVKLLATITLVLAPSVHSVAGAPGARCRRCRVRSFAHAPWRSSRCSAALGLRAPDAPDSHRTPGSDRSAA